MVQAHAYELLNQKESEFVPQGPGLDQHPLYAATDRLVAALDRLERNMHRLTADKSRDVAQHEQLTLFQRENESLRQEQENLHDTIDRLQHQYNDLHKVASAIYGKLEDSIKRLTRIIEN